MEITVICTDMKRIPKDKIDEIFNVADIVEVINDYLPLKKRGANFWALSPFSNEKTPSFSVSPAKGIYKDFSSGKGGNVVSFLMDVEGFSYPEALVHLAKKYNINIEYEVGEETVDSDEENKRKQSVFIINNFANDFFQSKLQSQKGKAIALSYLKNRGLRDDIIQKFQLGYAPDSWDDFSQKALGNQFQKEVLLDAGLSSLTQKGTLVDRFRDRIIFPIHNVSGRIVAFGGRALKSGERTAKYINSPETPIYNKSEELFGLFFSKNALRKENNCVLVEGYMDLIALFQAGIENVVATSGTALTNAQIRKIKRYTKNVTFLYDGDEAGVKATLRGIDLLLAEDIAVKVVNLPDNHDPDSYLKDFGKEKLLGFIEKNGKDFLEFKLSYLESTSNFNEPQAQTLAIHELASSLANIQDTIRRSLYTKAAAERLYVSEQLLISAVNKEILQKKRQKTYQNRTEKEPIRQAEVIQTAVSPVFFQEQEILRILINHAGKSLEIEGDEIDLVSYIHDEIENYPFENRHLEWIKSLLINNYFEKKNVDLRSALHASNEKIASLLIDLLYDSYEISANWEKYDIILEIDENLEDVVESVLLHYKLKKIVKLLDENRQKLKSAKSDEELDKYLMVHQKLEVIKQELGDQLGSIIIK